MFKCIASMICSNQSDILTNTFAKFFKHQNHQQTNLLVHYEIKQIRKAKWISCKQRSLRQRKMKRTKWLINKLNVCLGSYYSKQQYLLTKKIGIFFRLIHCSYEFCITLLFIVYYELHIRCYEYWMCRV